MLHVGLKSYSSIRSFVGNAGLSQLRTSSFSVIRDKIGVTEIGRKSDRLLGLTTLGTGETIAVSRVRGEYQFEKNN